MGNVGFVYREDEFMHSDLDLKKIMIMATIAYSVISTACAQPVLITAPLTVGPADTAISSTDGTVTAPLPSAEITVQGTVLTFNGRHEIASMTLEPGPDDTFGTLTHDVGFQHEYLADGQDIVSGLHLIVAGDFIVNQGTGIDVSGRGYGFREGPGVGVNNNCAGGGAGHGGGGGFGSGGCGGNTAGGTPYGSMYAPIEFGSGGTDDDNFNPRGGGAIRLDIGGRLEVSGVVRADATDGLSGRGAGGSIYIRCSEFAGNGEISANGGNVQRAFNAGDGGGGGGGRIAIYHGDSTFTGSIEAVSGDGAQPGAPGSIVLQQTGGPRTVIYDNLGLSCIATVPVGGAVETDTLIVRGNARLSHEIGNEAGLTVDADTVIVEQDGLIDATGRGYGFRQGPGRGFNNNCAGGGGGYGGFGGRGSGGCGGNPAGGTAYGIVQYPANLGSGGADDDNFNPRAGGRVTLNVAGQITVDGVIGANATNGFGGRGSGGAILIYCDSITGAGVIEANGGDATRAFNAGDGGGGGGGRIAVYACGSIDNEVGLTVFNGDGAQDGTPGSVFIALNEADLNGDQALDLSDVDYFIDAFINGYEPADLTRDGVIDLDDIDTFITAFLAGCP